MTGPDAIGRARELMMAALDGELSAADRTEFDGLLAADPALRDEWARLTRVKEATSAMMFKQPPQEMWDRYWMSVYNRTERTVAWLLVAAGAIVVAAWWLWHAVPALAEWLFDATDIPVAVRLAIVALIIGGVLLVVSVVREQFTIRRTDDYDKGVSR